MATLFLCLHHNIPRQMPHYCYARATIFLCRGNSICGQGPCYFYARPTVFLCKGLPRVLCKRVLPRVLCKRVIILSGKHRLPQLALWASTDHLSLPSGKLELPRWIHNIPLQSSQNSSSAGVAAFPCRGQKIPLLGPSYSSAELMRLIRWGNKLPLQS